MSKRAASAALLVGILLGLLIHAPGIGAGYVGDDHLQNAMLEGTYPVRRAVWDLYAFVDAPRGDVPALREAGTMPWWTHPDLELTAFRPLSSLLLAFDHLVLRLGPLGKHLHSVAWWIALVLAQAALVRGRVPLAVAVPTTLLFALDPAHASPIAWIANRTAFVSTLLGTLALLAHARWREGGAWRWGAAAFAGWAAALAGGEYGLCMVAYALAYEALAAPPGWRGRLAGLAMVGAPTAVYAVVRAAIGYGAHGSSVYVDTSLGPAFYKLALVRWLALLGDESWLMASEASSWAAMVNLVSFGFLVLTLVGFLALFQNAVRDWAVEERRFARALLAGAALSAVPTVSAFPSTRLLVPASVGGSVAIAAILVHGWRAVRDRARRWPARLGQGAALATVALLHVAIGPLATYLRGRLWADVHAIGDTLYLAAPLADSPRGPRPSLVLLSAPDPMTTLYPPYVAREAGLSVSGAWRVLCACTPGQTFVRTAPDTLEVLGDSGYVVGTHAWLLRAADAGFQTGERVTTSTMTVEIVEQQGGRARRVRYRFDRPLDDPSLVLMVFDERGIVRVPAPAIGGHIAVPDVFSKLHAATAPWAQEGGGFRPGVR